MDPRTAIRAIFDAVEASDHYALNAKRLMRERELSVAFALDLNTDLAFEALGLERESLAALESVAYEQDLAAAGITLEESQAIVKVFTAAADQDVRAGVSADGRRLVVDIAITGDPDPVTQEPVVTHNYLDIQLDDGTEIRTSLDVIAALANVITGRGHEWLRDPGEIQGYTTDGRTIFSAIGDQIGALGNVWEEHDGMYNWIVDNVHEVYREATMQGDGSLDWSSMVDTDTLLDREQDREREAINREWRSGGLSDESLAVSLAQSLYEETGDPVGASYAASGQILAYGGDYRDMAGAEMDRMLVEDPGMLDRMLEQAGRGRESALKSDFDQAFSHVQNGLLWWGKTLDWIGVHMMDTFGDLQQGFGGIVTDAFHGEFDPADAFARNWEVAKEERLSEYWDIEGDAGFMLDITANLLLDPLTWIGVGQVRQAGMWRKMMATPEGAAKFMGLRTTRGFVGELALGLKMDRPMALLAFTDSMHPLHASELRKLTPRLRGMSQAKAEEAVADVVRRSLPGSGEGGTFLMNFHGHHASRNHASQVYAMSKSAFKEGRTSAMSRFLTRTLGGFKRDRALSLAPNRVTTDASHWIVQTYWDNPAAAAKAHTKIMDAYEEYLVGWKAEAAVGKRQIDELTLRTNALQRVADPAEIQRLLKGVWGPADRPQRTANTMDDFLEAHGSATKRLDELDQSIKQFTRQGNTEALAAAQAERDLVAGGRWARLKEARRELKRARRQGLPTEALSREISELRHSTMIRALDDADETIEVAMRQHAKYLEEEQAIRLGMEEARLKLAAVSRPGSRDPFARVLAEIEDDYARNVLKLDELDEIHPILRDRNALDWEPVTGSKTGYSEDAERLAPLLGNLDPDDAAALARQFRTGGFFDTQSSYYLHASPMEMIAYRNVVDSKKGKAFWARYLRGSVGDKATKFGERVAPFVDFFQRTFCTILLAPRIAFRSGLDETLRYYMTTGRPFGKFAYTGISQEGALTGKMALPGPAEVSVRQFGRGSVPGLEGTKRPWRVGMDFSDRTSMAIRQSFGQAKPFGKDPSGWTLVGRQSGRNVVASKRMHREAGFRWAGHNLFEDDGMIAFAQAVQNTARRDGISAAEVITRKNAMELMDKDAFLQWWSVEGRVTVQPYAMDLQGAGASFRGADDAMAAARNGMELLARDSSSMDEVLNELISRMSQGSEGKLVRGEKASERLVRKLGPMPTDQYAATLSDRAGLPARAQDAMFNVMYGMPGENRFGVIHADHYDRALKVLLQGNEKVLLTPKRLSEIGDMAFANVDEARAFMARNPSVLDRIAMQYGYVTSRQLETAADAFARQQAQHLMYQPGATSLLGKKMQRFMPFGPAQYDFMSWWGYKMTEATTFGAFGHYKQIPNFLNFKAMANHADLGALPFNARLAARAMDMGAVTAKTIERVEERGDLEGGDLWDKVLALNPTKLIEELTFLPRVDSFENFWVDVAPGLGPIPAWAIRFLPDPDNLEGGWAGLDADNPLVVAARNVRMMAEDAVPTAGWGDESAWTTESFLNAMFPKYQGSARDLAESFYTVVAKGSQVLFGGDGGWGAAAGLEGPMEREFFRWGYINQVNDRDGQFLAEASSTLEETVVRLGYDANAAATNQDLIQSALHALPFGRLGYTAPDDTLVAFEGMIGELPGLVEKGLLGAAEAARQAENWALWKQGGPVDPRRREELSSVMHNILIELRKTDEVEQARLIRKYPGLAVLTVGSYRCAVNEDGSFKGDSDWCKDDGRPNLPGGPEAVEKIGRGKELGYYVDRSNRQIGEEVEYRLAQVQRTLLRDAFQTLYLEGFNAHLDEDEAAMERTDYRAGDPHQRVRTHLYDAELTPDMRQQLRDGGILIDDTEILFGSELMDRIKDANNTLNEIDFPWDTDTSVAYYVKQIPGGIEFLEAIASLRSDYQNEGVDSPLDWEPEDLRQIREGFEQLWEHDNGDGFREEDYNREYSRWYGPSDWEMDRPPVFADLEDTYYIDVNLDTLLIVDGDSLNVQFPDGSHRDYRLIGINAPDDPMPGAYEARKDLTDLIRNEGYENIQLVFYKPDVYGTTAGINYDTGEPRWKAWLYVDGYPVYNERVFTHRNPLGIGAGKDFVKLPRPGII